METFTYLPIEKEVVSSLSFTKKSGIKRAEKVYERLVNATTLGNVYHSKVTIYFFDDEGPKKVSTTIWAIDSEFICLKGGMWIPISRIIDVEYNF